MQKVLWTKGVLLSPQHLQTQDRFLESLLEFELSSLTFCPWGFTRLEIDREALAGGMLGVTRAAGILPDGLPFDAPGADAVPEPKPLRPHWAADQEMLDVFLAVPEHRLGAQNVSIAGQERNTRYAAEIVLRHDENTGLSEKPVQLARKNLRLLTETENLEGNAVLPLARVRRDAAGGLQLDLHFVPPLLDTSASDYLLAINRRLVEIMSAKSTTLSGMRRQRNRRLADFGVADVANFWLLYTVNTHLPRFRHLLETRRGHPAELFAAMLELAGALTTFSSAMHPRSLPSYEHNDLGSCFAALDHALRELLETVVPATHLALPMTMTQASIHVAAIDEDRFFGAAQIYLAIQAAMKQDELLRKAPQLVKLSSAGQIERLIRQALPGVRLQHVPVPPSALPIKLDYHYFLLDRDGGEWEAIRQTRNVAAYVPSDFPEAKLELVLVLPPADG